MKPFTVPIRAEVSENNQAIFDSIKEKMGFVPNLFAYMSKNEKALNDYLLFESRKSTLRGKEKELINLVVSQINGCRYCQSAHTAAGKMFGLTDEQIIEIRNGSASFDSKLDALVKFTASVAKNRGVASETSKIAFFGAGYSEEYMIDVVMRIGVMTINTYLHQLADFPIDFPLAPEISTELV